MEQHFARLIQCRLAGSHRQHWFALCHRRHYPFAWLYSINRNYNGTVFCVSSLDRQGVCSIMFTGCRWRPAFYRYQRHDWRNGDEYRLCRIRNCNDCLQLENLPMCRYKAIWKTPSLGIAVVCAGNRIMVISHRLWFLVFDGTQSRTCRRLQGLV